MGRVWSKEPPGRAGWYWFRLTDPHVPEEVSTPVMLLVSEGAGGRIWAEDTVNRERYPVRDLEGLWAGPLSPPAAASRSASPVRRPLC